MEIDPEIEGLTKDELLEKIKGYLEEINDVEILETIEELAQATLEMTEEQADIMFDYMEDKEPTVENAKEAIAYAKSK